MCIRDRYNILTTSWQRQAVLSVSKKKNSNHMIDHSGRGMIFFPWREEVSFRALSFFFFYSSLSLIVLSTCFFPCQQAPWVETIISSRLWMPILVAQRSQINSFAQIWTWPLSVRPHIRTFRSSALVYWLKCTFPCYFDRHSSVKKFVHVNNFRSDIPNIFNWD